jgi:hypothetical protein
MPCISSKKPWHFFCQMPAEFLIGKAPAAGPCQKKVLIARQHFFLAGIN